VSRISPTAGITKFDFLAFQTCNCIYLRSLDHQVPLILEAADETSTANRYYLFHKKLEAIVQKKKN